MKQLDFMLLKSEALTYRGRIKDLLDMAGINVDVCIGGSIALKFILGDPWNCSYFSELEPHDIDIVIIGKEENLSRAKQFIATLSRFFQKHNGSEGSGGSHYHLGKTSKGYPVDVLFAEGIPNGNAWNSPERILVAKWNYCLKAIRMGKMPREKDVRDIKHLQRLYPCVTPLNLE